MNTLKEFNPDYAVATYCGLKNLATTITNMPSAQNRSNFSFR